MTVSADFPRKDYYASLIPGLPPLQKLMLALDVAVTGVPAERAVSQYHHMPENLEEWFQQPGGNPMWYLADSGYSRVVWSTETGNLFLTSNSTSKAKERWEQAKPQRDALQQYLKDEYNRLLGEVRFESRAEVIVDVLLEAGPRINTLKNNRRPLSAEERALVMSKGAVWHHGEKGKESPAVWKAVVGNKTYYICNTHRAAQVKPTLKAAIRAFDFIKTTS